MIVTRLREPWPWYVSGPLIGLFVPLLLVLGNRQFGMSGSLRAICAACVPTNVAFFRYDWRTAAAWNVAIACGILLGAALGVAFLDAGTTPAIAESTRGAIAAMGLAPPSGLVPTEVFNWHSLLTLRGAISMLGGGFLVGFGASYAGGCTSGHGVMGLASLELPSFLAMAGIFAGGLLATFALMPLLF